MAIVNIQRAAHKAYYRAQMLHEDLIIAHRNTAIMDIQIYLAFMHQSCLQAGASMKRKEVARASLDASQA